MKPGDRVSVNYYGIRFDATVMRVEEHRCLVGINEIPDGASLSPTGKHEDTPDGMEEFRYCLHIENQFPSLVRAPSPSRDFPHRCPKCGGRAYIGFLRVEHEGEIPGLDEGCP